MATAGENTYKISCAAVHRRRLLAWGQAAKRAGLLQEYGDVIEEIVRQLRPDPIGWGDPLFTYHQLELLVLHNVCRFVHVSYAVDEVRRIVYIQSFKLTQGHPLGEVD